MMWLRAGFQWLGLKGSILLAVVALLGGMLTLEKLSHADTRGNLAQMTTRYQAEAAAHRQTVLTYRAAAEKARREDAENKLRVERQRKLETERITRDYQARLADARARYERLRDQPKVGTNPRAPGAAPVPGVPGPASGADDPAAEDGFSLLDRLIATEQAIRLEGLQQWIRSMQRVPTSPGSPSSSGSVNR